MNYNSTFIIEKKRIQDNLETIFKKAPKKTAVIPVLKANAYGHGLVLVAQILEDYPQIKTLAVAQTIEAITLKENKISKDIMLLCGITKDQVKTMVDNHIQLLIHDLDSLFNILEVLKEKNIENYPVNLKINTGLNRLGFTQETLQKAIPIIKDNKHIQIMSTYSHFIEGATINSPISIQQKLAFDSALDLLVEKGINPGIRHLCDSGAFDWYEDAYYDAVRIGRALYMDSPHKKEEDRFKDAGSWHAKLIAKRTIQEGESVGYGKAYVATKPTHIGIINVGYGDGMMILDDQIKRECIVDNQRATILSVAMDQSYINLHDIDPEVGSVVTLYGSAASGAYISTNETTQQFDDEGCTLTTLLSHRVKRIMK